MAEWISVKDKLPDTIADVLIYNGKWIDMGCYQSTTGRFYSSYTGHWRSNITHWMPLPKPPKADV